jgi:Cu+-exporting ATPase
MKKVILSIDGMTCSACSNSLEKHLNKQKGIINANVNLVMQQALIEYQDDLTLNDLSDFVSEAGFKSLGLYDEKKEKDRTHDKKLLIVYTILSILVLYISMSHMINLPVIPFLNMEKYPVNYALCLLILSLPYLYYVKDILKSGYNNLIHKAPNMDTLVSIGVLASLLYSFYSTIMIILGNTSYVENIYFESACLVIYFIKLGRLLDSTSKEKTTSAIKELVTITPEKALLKVKDTYKEVTIDEVKVGDILVCLPGTRVAVDGVITKGITHIDESFITGESIPVKKEKESTVTAGSINIDGYIEYKALKIGRDSTISEIVRLVMEATNTKSPISKLADKVSGIFVPTIILISLITFISYLLLGYNLNIALTHFVTVLVVACPCALGLATPLAIVVSSGVCAKNGILVKSSEILENAHKVDTIIFDKTGTLTFGNLKISKINNYSSYKDIDLLKIVSSIELKSNHPISNSFKTYLKENNIKPLEIDDFKNLDGLGLSCKISNKKYYLGNNKILKKLNINNDYLNAEKEMSEQGNSIIYVIEDNKIISLIGIKDTIRSNVKTVIKKLKEQNKDVIMLTGDNEITASIIAKELGITNVISNVLPKDKTAKIKELMSNNKKVMMIGDGINDAPSLATANIGIAMGCGTDIANNSADIILMNDNLMNIVNLINISKKTLINIKENLFWAFFYNICMLPIAIGLLEKFNINMNPMLGSIAMTISSLTVILNALRLKRIKINK